MKWKPGSKEELYNIIKEIITNQDKDPKYPYGLRDIDVSLITDMSNLFSCYESDKNSNINKKINWKDPKNNITNWNVSHVTDMEGMFSNSPFNQNINHWDVSQVTDMSYMFNNSTFNQDISLWNVNNVTNMFAMFTSSPFNQDISYWDVSHVINMDHMFYNSDFNHPLGHWYVSSVTSMSYMFFKSNFNQPIGNWDVSHVTNMRYMFYGSKFEQNLFLWINQLNVYVDLYRFNKNSPHEKKYGSIYNIDSFIENQLTPQIWLKQYKESNDREKFQLLKQLKNYNKKFIETLNQRLKKENVMIDI